MSNQNQGLPEFFTKHRCAEFCGQRAQIVVRDKHNKQTYQLENAGRRTCCLLRVDGCLLSSGAKCDYLLLADHRNEAFFIELKGQDLLKAFAQIDHSISALLPHLQGWLLYARVVLNKVRTPALKSSVEMKLERRLKEINKQNQRAFIVYKNQLLHERLE